MNDGTSKTDAKRKVWKRRQGRGWVVCTLTERGIEEGPERDYFQACQIVRDARYRLWSGMDADAPVDCVRF